MSTHLDPLILKKLQEFARRRRKLILWRGVCAAIAMLIATMMLVALVDWVFVLDDWIRWTLSGIAYAAVLVAEWRACLRLLVHMPDPRRVARLIEHAEPKLREDLISAVELGQGDAALDSEQFRQLVQSGVATRLEGVDVQRLLPVYLLRRSLLLAGAIVMVCVGTLALTGFQFGTSMIRALLPMLNLARVSKVQVHVVEPHPADETVAQGDAVPLLIEITGQRTNKAVLEIFTKTGGHEVVAMNPSAKDQFSASIQVAREDVEYRIRAGDAMTQKFHLKAAARPHVVRFFKTYNFPEYSRLQPKQVTEETGDLVALEQTQVDLQLETDQPAKAAELHIEQGKVNTTVPLTLLPNGRLDAKVPLEKSGIYRVHLVAAETGFENKFSPEYELRANPDLIPQIELETPQHDLILPANEILDVTGTATDDLAIDHVEQQFRVNGGKWETLPIKTASGPMVKVENRWDLLQQGLKAGDTITTKLVAYDLKKNKGESRPVQITLTASGFEVKRLEALEEQRKLLQSLTALRTAGDALEKRGNESNDQFGRLAESDPQRKQALISFTSALDEVQLKQSQTAGLLITALHHAAPGHDTGNLVLLGRLLARSAAGSAQSARDDLNAVDPDPAAPFARDLVRDAAVSSARAAQRLRTAHESLRTFVVCEGIDVLNENLQVVAREQERIAALAEKSGDDPAKWAQLISRMRVVLTEARSLGELMNHTAEYSVNGSQERLRQIQKRIEEQTVIVDRLLAANAVGKDLFKPTKALARTLTENRRNMLDLRGAVGDQPVQALNSLAQEAQPDWSNFEQIRQEADAILRDGKLPKEVRTTLATARWTAKDNLFKAHGDFEEARPDADTYFVGDVRQLTLALDALRTIAVAQAVPSPEWDGSVKQIAALDQAFRVLESGHNLSELAAGLDHLAAAERWDFAALRSRTSNPRDWRWDEKRLQMNPDEMGRTQLANEDTRKIMQKAQQVLWDANGAQAKPINEEMWQRFKVDREPVAVPREVQRLAERVREALALLRKPMEEARQVLAQMAPSLSQMAAELAKEAQDLKKESEDQAAKAAEKPPEKAQADAQQQLAAQQKLDDKVDALKDALRADAGKQDVLKQEGRDRARDADDALAMLKEPPPRAEQALSDAAQLDRTAEKQDALKAAATEQQKLADALNQVAKHYDALEKGDNPQDTRTALRDAENALGVKEQLDQQYANAEQLAELAGMSPEQMLKQLEKALPKNPVMQQELSAISQHALDAAGANLAEASNRENNVAKDVQKVADQQQAQAQAQAQQQAKAQGQAATPDQNQTAQNQAAQNPPKGDQNAAAQPAGQTPPAPGQTAQNAAQPQNQAGQPNAQDAQAQAAPQPNQNAQPGATPPAAQPPNPQLAQAAGQQPKIAAAADQAAAEIQRAGRHEERLQNTAAGQQLQQLGQQVEQTAQKQVPQAQQALAAAQMAAQAQAPVNTANADLQAELARLNQEQGGQPPAPDAAAPAGQQPNGAQPQPGEQAQAAPPQAGQQAAAQQGQAAQPPAGAQAAAQAGQPAGQQPPQQANANGQPAAPQAQAGQPAGAPPPAGAGEQGQPEQMAATPATAAEQTWMARTLDALDAALHPPEGAGQQGTQADAQSGQPGQQGQQAQQGQQPGQPGQQNQQGQPGQGQEAQGQPGQSAEALAQAQQAMNAAAQANAAAMRSTRAEGQAQQPGSEVAQGEEQAMSKGGAKATAGTLNHGVMPDLHTAQNGDWGRLPKKVAEQLSQGQREGVAGEYRNQIETYYRVIAERAKKDSAR